MSRAIALLTISAVLSLGASSAISQIRSPQEGFSYLNRFDLALPASSLSLSYPMSLAPVAVRLGLAFEPSTQGQSNSDFALRLRFAPTTSDVDKPYSLDLTALVGPLRDQPCDKYSLAGCMPRETSSIHSVADLTRLRGFNFRLKLRY
jgi:hypothetical protein